MIEENLKKLDFTGNESRIYLAVIRLGKVRAGKIIKETNLQRSVVYAGLERLAERGLVSKSVSKGVSLYSISDPDALVQEAENRKVLAAAVSEDLKARQGAKNREVIIYEGEDIVKRISDKNLDSKLGSTMYFLGSSKFGVQANLERYWQQYHKKRIERKMHCKILYDRSTEPEIVADRNSMEFCEAKFLPFESQMPMWFSICEDSVGMVVPSEDPPLAFLIRSEKTAQALKSYFDYLWSQSNQSK